MLEDNISELRTKHVCNFLVEYALVLSNVLLCHLKDTNRINAIQD
jgi:hypothetical protein